MEKTAKEQAYIFKAKLIRHKVEEMFKTHGGA